MLYIIDIDTYSFGLSGTGATSGDIEVVYPKEFYAISTNPAGTSTNGLVSVKHSDEESMLISSREPSGITLDGVVYPTANAFAIAFNHIMNNSDVPTTTEAPTTTAAATTTEEVTTT